MALLELLCQHRVGSLDEPMGEFRRRPREGEHSYAWLHAKAVKVRQEGRGVNIAALIAVGGAGDKGTGSPGIRGAAETREFWAGTVVFLTE